MKHTSTEALEAIHPSSVLTIQPSASLSKLTPEQNAKFAESIELLIAEGGMETNAVQTVFRGVSRNHLLPILTNGRASIGEAKLLYLLFYFGEKAKHYYKLENPVAEKSRWIKNIEDCSEKSSKVIFDKIRKIMRKDNEIITAFVENTPSFKEYFESDNRDEFTRLLMHSQSLRDYYLFFLHTAGKIGVGGKTLLISASSSPDTPKCFFQTGEDNYIIFYVIPRNAATYSVSHRSIPSDMIVKNVSQTLPVYNGNSLYPNQQEVALKGAMFSHHMLGVMTYPKCGEKCFVANPHLFSSFNTPQAILTGLHFDQLYFELKETGYYRGVALSLDGNYTTL